MKFYAIVFVLASLVSNVNGKSSTAVSLFDLLSKSSSGSSTPDSSTMRNLSPLDTIVVIQDGSTKPTGRRRLNEERDYTLQALVCDAEANRIHSYHSYLPSSGTSPVINPLKGTAQAQCGKYTVVVETVANQVGCNAQNNPNGCNQTFAPGCGGLSVNPLTKDLYVARTGGRTIGRLINVNAGKETCESRVVDWLIKYRGKKFNGPTDITFTSKGNLYFADPPFALASNEDQYLSSNLSTLDLKRELSFSGVFLRPSNGTIKAIDCSMSRPKSLAFSPNEDVLYVANADAQDPYIKSFQLGADGVPTCSHRFFNLSQYVAGNNCSRPYPTSIKVNSDGLVYIAMCKAIYIVSATGDYLRQIDVANDLSGIAFSQGYLLFTANKSLSALPLEVSFKASQKVVDVSDSCESVSAQVKSSNLSSTNTLSLASATTIGCVAVFVAFSYYKSAKASTTTHEDDGARRNQF
uniref:Secreted protein n=1 Tax=Thraustotheca clavata TaxID=74557 RepID=A0A0A7CLT2_9STRA|nr:secreted protein [Thraustotheca clavata]